MADKPAHIIQKQLYDIAVPTEKVGIKVQQSLNEVTLQYLLPALGSKLDELFHDDAIVVIEKLELNLGVINANADPQEWVDKMMSGLENAMQQLVHPKVTTITPGLVRLSKAQYAARVWLYFLKTGMLLPECIFKNIAAVKEVLWNLTTLEKELVKDEFLKPAYTSTILQRVVSLSRKEFFLFLQLFVPNVSEKEWDVLCEKIDNILQGATQHRKFAERVTVKVFQKTLYIFLLETIIQLAKEGRMILPNELIKAVEDWSTGMLLKDNTSNERLAYKEEASTTEIGKLENVDIEQEQGLPGKGIFVGNVGICLLAPYLPPFFKELNLGDGAQFYTPAKQQQAIFLVHHLATGEEDASEEKLVFAKLLCGWPLLMPCLLEDEISAKEKEESIELLQSVIGHWAVLKNTSPDGLREAFLQRDGKLTDDGDNYILQVAQQTLDILLDQVPWTFRMIKFPWMKKMVVVEWY